MSTQATRLLVMLIALALGGAAQAQPPADVKTLESQAAEALAEGRFTDAGALYRQLRTRTNKPYLKELSAVRHGLLAAEGDAARKAGDLKTARDRYRKALEEGPSTLTERKLFAVEMRLKASTGMRKQLERARVLITQARQDERAGRLAQAMTSLQRAAALLGRRSGPESEAIAAARVRVMAKIEAQEYKQLVDLAHAARRARDWATAVRELKAAQKLRELAPADRAALLGCLRELAVSSMVLIPAGKSWIGSQVPDERPLRQVALGAFYIDRTEVTNSQYLGFVQESGHRPPVGWGGGLPPEGRMNYPVVGVSLRDAEAFARWAGKRLPTELEWERAARGGDDQRAYPWGAAFARSCCNALEEGVGGVAPVGSYPEGRSPFGVDDMLGNALEWTSSKYVAYPGGQVWPGKAERYVLRGGCWYYSSEHLRVSARYPDRPDSRLKSYGFRCAMSVR